MIPEMRCLDGFAPGPPDECWPWQGSIEATGYGSGGPHRQSYRILVGPIPPKMVLDHVCHTLDLECPGGVICLHRRCVNPGHLEPVTRSENSRRGGLGMAWRPRVVVQPPVEPPVVITPRCRREPLMKQDEAARRIGVSVAQLTKWRLRGGGPPFGRLGAMPGNSRSGLLRYDPRDLDAWLREQLKAAPLTAFAQPDLTEVAA